MSQAPTSRHVRLGLHAGLKPAASLHAGLEPAASLHARLEPAVALVRRQCCRVTEARSQITS
jgi:hypothetical protein